MGDGGVEVIRGVILTVLPGVIVGVPDPMGGFAVREGMLANKNIIVRHRVAMAVKKANFAWCGSGTCLSLS